MCYSTKLGRMWVRKVKYGYECVYKLRGKSGVVMFAKHLGPNASECWGKAKESLLSQVLWQNGAGAR